MLKSVDIDRNTAGEFVVAWFARGAVRARTFGIREEAEAFAWNKAGARGCVISSLDMTPAQLAAHEARRERAAALLATLPEAAR